MSTENPNIEEKKRMLGSEQWVLEEAGERFGFSAEEASEPLTVLIRHQQSLDELLGTVDHMKGNRQEKKERLISGLEELTKALNEALAKLKEVK